MARLVPILLVLALLAGTALAVLPTRDEPVRTVWLIRHGEYEHGVDTPDEGGLVALGEDTLDFRMKSSRVKVDQVRGTGATILTTACENCHTQLSNLNDHYKMGMEVQFLSSMVADALVPKARTRILSACWTRSLLLPQMALT